MERRERERNRINPRRSIPGNRFHELRNRMEAAMKFTASTAGDSECSSCRGVPSITLFFFYSVANQAVHEQLLSKIDRALSLSEQDDISTVKLSAHLDLLTKAYKCACSVTQDKLSLYEGSVTALDNSDAALKRFLSSRKTDEDQAKKELADCEHFAGALTNTCK